MRNHGIAENVDVVVQGKAVQQGVGVNEKRDGQQHDDAPAFFHAKEPFDAVTASGREQKELEGIFLGVVAERAVADFQ
jgi:hypothetical protein